MDPPLGVFGNDDGLVDDGDWVYMDNRVTAPTTSASEAWVAAGVEISFSMVNALAKAIQTLGGNLFNVRANTGETPSMAA